MCYILCDLYTLCTLQGEKLVFEVTYYVDCQGYEVVYRPGENELGSTYKNQIYWHFNGFLLLGIF